VGEFSWFSEKALFHGLINSWISNFQQKQQKKQVIKNVCLPNF